MPKRKTRKRVKRNRNVIRSQASNIPKGIKSLANSREKAFLHSDSLQLTGKAGGGNNQKNTTSRDNSDILLLITLRVLSLFFIVTASFVYLFKIRNSPEIWNKIPEGVKVCIAIGNFILLAANQKLYRDERKQDFLIKKLITQRVALSSIILWLVILPLLYIYDFPGKIADFIIFNFPAFGEENNKIISNILSILASGIAGNLATMLLVFVTKRIAKFVK